jgi:hypothetical protein
MLLRGVLLRGAAVAPTITGLAQQAMPVVGFLRRGSR